MQSTSFCPISIKSFLILSSDIRLHLRSWNSDQNSYTLRSTYGMIGRDIPGCNTKEYIKTGGLSTSTDESTLNTLCVISGFRCDVNEIYALLGFHAACTGSLSPMFRDELLVLSSMAKQSRWFGFGFLLFGDLSPECKILWCWYGDYFIESNMLMLIVSSCMLNFGSWNFVYYLEFLTGSVEMKLIIFLLFC
jgi:hypothetical protein